MTAFQDPSSGPNEVSVNFDQPASLRKWPSYAGKRLADPTGPYLIVATSLGECIREYMARPAAMRHLYEIHTTEQPPLVTSVLTGAIVVALARLRNASGQN